MKYAIFLMLFVCGIAGCDLFSTRTPDPPDTGATFIWTPATTVDYLLTNFTGTLQLMDASNYERVFIEGSDSTGAGSMNYNFIPAPGIDQSSKSIFTGWSPESERAWLAKLKTLLAKNSKLTVLLTNTIIDQSANTAAVSADYSISLPIDPTSTVLPSVVTGSLQFRLQLVSTEQQTKEWRIVQWSDFAPKISGGSTWTDLKVRLSS